MYLTKKEKEIYCQIRKLILLTSNLVIHVSGYSSKTSISCHRNIPDYLEHFKTCQFIVMINQNRKKSNFSVPGVYTLI